MTRRAGGAYTVAHASTCRRVTRVAGAALPTPPLAGVYAWYDAAAITGVADGAGVASWADLSAHNHPLTQATGANQPVYHSTGALLVNAKPIVYFTPQQALSAAATLAQPFTFFVVLAQKSGVNLYAGIPLIDGTGNLSMIPRLVSTPKWSMYANGGGIISGGTVTANPTLVAGVYNDAASVLRQDRAQVAAGTSIGTLGLAANLWVGNNSGLAGGWTGPVAELLFYPSALVAGDVTTVETYLAAKWGTP